MAITTRWSLRYPVNASAADVPTDMQNLANDLDNVAKDDQGIFSSRPAAATALKGFWYYSTDNTTRLARSDGANWVEVILSSNVRTGLTTLIQNKLLTADAQPAFRIDGFGTQYWGPGGASAYDTTMYRSNVSELTTDGVFKGFTITATSVLNASAVANLAGSGGTLGFWGHTATTKPAARTLTNWTSGSNGLRSIDRSSYTLNNLFDFVMTMAFDHQQTGLFT